MKRISISDIAKSAGVSKSLVSLVLNGRGDAHGISKQTQKKVREVAENMNYRPNSTARSLRTGKTETIGLIIADIGNPFFARLARSIEDYAFTKGYHLIFSSSDESPELEEQLIEMMQNRQVDGLIISSTLVKENSTTLQRLQKANFPFVLIDRYIPEMDFSYVVSDNERGTMELVQHMVDQGRKKIALFTISPSHLTSITDRIAGFNKALKKNGIKEDKDLIIEIPFDDIDSLDRSFDIITKKGVDAVITLNNSLAHECIKACQKRSINIPEDIAFASFDDVDWFQLVNPGITGVKQPIIDMGKRAVELLLDKLEGNSPGNEQVYLQVQLNIRESSTL